MPVTANTDLKFEYHRRNPFLRDTDDIPHDSDDVIDFLKQEDMYVPPDKKY